MDVCVIKVVSPGVINVNAVLMFVNTNGCVCVFVCQRVVNGPGAPTMTGTPLTSDYGRKEPVPHHLPFPGSLLLLLSSLLVLSVGPFSF